MLVLKLYAICHDFEWFMCYISHWLSPNFFLFYIAHCLLNMNFSCVIKLGFSCLVCYNNLIFKDCVLHGKRPLDYQIVCSLFFDIVVGTIGING